MSLWPWEVPQVWRRVGFPAPLSRLCPSHPGMAGRMEEGSGRKEILELSPCPCRDSRSGGWALQIWGCHLVPAGIWGVVVGGHCTPSLTSPRAGFGVPLVLGVQPRVAVQEGAIPALGRIPVI